MINNIQSLSEEDLKLFVKYQKLYSPNKDPILVAIAQWTYYNGNENSFSLLCELDLTEFSVNCILSVIRDYPNMREDEAFKERLYSIGTESEKKIADFITKFWKDLSFYDTEGVVDIAENMVKRPELGTSSRRYMNSVRYKKKVKEKSIEEIKEENENSYKKVKNYTKIS